MSQLELFAAGRALPFAVDEFTGRFDGLIPIPAGKPSSEHPDLPSAEAAARARNKTTRGRLCVVVDTATGLILY